MPANYADLDAVIQEGVVTATELETQAESVVVILSAVEEQTVARLVNDNALDQISTDKAVADVRAVFARAKAVSQKIATAISANAPV